MKEQPFIDVPPWALPALVLAITVPILLVWLVAGPFFGFLVAGLIAASVAVVAIRLESEPPRRRGRTRAVRARPDEREQQLLAPRDTARRPRGQRRSVSS
jgi:hypothetical protein